MSNYHRLISCVDRAGELEERKKVMTRIHYHCTAGGKEIAVNSKRSKKQKY